MMHPFVLMSKPNSLKELHKMGYKTFSPFINESYDSIENDNDRFAAIWLEISCLNNKSAEEWIEWQQNVKEIVEYNHNHFFTTQNHTITENIAQYFI
jgi:alpha/beta superfamily hydrolase